MKSNGFLQSDADSCIYIQDTDTLSIVAVYADDLIIATKTNEEMQEVKQMLQSQFEMKELYELHYCLGVNIRQNKADRAVEIHQKQYILRMLEKYGLKPVTTLADLNVKLRRDDGVSKAVDPVLYQSMVGSLLYAAIATKPNISHAVGVIAQNPQRLT